MSLTQRDRERLAGVHKDLVRVIEAAARRGPVRFLVSEGVRTVERQRELVDSKASRTMNSRHLTGHAVDLAVLMTDGKVRWDAPIYRQLAKQVKAAAESEGVPIEWGGDFRGFFDGPHFQLPRDKYP